MNCATRRVSAVEKASAKAPIAIGSSAATTPRKNQSVSASAKGSATSSACVTSSLGDALGEHRGRDRPAELDAREALAQHRLEAREGRHALGLRAREEDQHERAAAVVRDQRVEARCRSAR